VVLVTSGLKELALTHRTAVVAAAACDEAALDGRGARLHHLRGSAALAYEADMALMLNPKLRAVSEVHRSFDPVRAQTFADKVVVSVEKNRGGPADVDVEFRAELDRFRFDPRGGLVAERPAG
jgi:replicative DNA helicase